MKGYKTRECPCGSITCLISGVDLDRWPILSFFEEKKQDENMNL